VANWSNPIITTQYDVFVAEVKDRDADTATLFSGSATNIPTGSVRFNRAAKTFEEWSGTAWVVLILAVAGGGTGANTGGGAGANLGLGSMAFQNSNSVGITGGTIDITWVIARSIICPAVNLGCDLGDSGRRFNKAYVAGGMVIPVGTDKYVVG
jgi:hypothetical protein